MIERLCAETVIFVLWSFSGVLMWLAWSLDLSFVLGCPPVAFKMSCMALALALFIAGFKILRKELEQ